MLASDHWADDIARTYDMGLGGYLIKPIRRSDLLQTISIAFDRSKGIQHTTGFSTSCSHISYRTQGTSHLIGRRFPRQSGAGPFLFEAEPVSP